LSLAPVLETPRLRLRERSTEDFDAYAAAWCDAEVMRHIAGGSPLSREDAWTRFARHQGFWALLGYGFWIVEERSTGDFVGEVGLADFRREMAPHVDMPFEFGWVLARRAHGRGYATEAASAALAWADAAFPGEAFHCIIHPGNAPSLRVADKCRFVEIGRASYKGGDTIVLKREGISWRRE
jgi:RimJ/RimL family protein N-acetyltransferase